MTELPSCYGIIPCRYGSTRFEGKPLAEIEGRKMYWRVYNQAKKCQILQRVVLATDSEKIFNDAKSNDVDAVMTSPDHPSGSDRVLEAAEALDVIQEDDVVINIQGDEPALDPHVLTRLIQPFSDPAVQVTTPVRRITQGEKDSADRVKVVFDNNHRALYFSRAPIPHPRDNKKVEFFLHIGIYAFRMGTLKKFVELGPGYLEETEKLEQLRLLENGIPIHIVKTEYKSIGVDRPEDIPEVEKIIRANRSFYE